MKSAKEECQKLNCEHLDLCHDNPKPYSHKLCKGLMIAM